MESFNKPVALITGASRGIGKEIAFNLARNGFCVALNATNKRLLNQVKSQIITEGGCAEIFPGNLTRNDKATGELIKQVDYEYGRLDVLINNAGVALAGPFSEISFEDFDRVMGLNVKAPLFLAQAALPLLKQAENPVIINISSVVGIKPYQNQSLYSASKHAMSGLMKAVAKELQDEGIRVHIISPGGVGTEMILETRPDLDAQSLIAPKEIAKVVSFLIDFKESGVIDEIRVRRTGNIPFD